MAVLIDIFIQFRNQCRNRLTVCKFKRQHDNIGLSFDGLFLDFLDNFQRAFDVALATANNDQIDLFDKLDLHVPEQPRFTDTIFAEDRRGGLVRVAWLTARWVALLPASHGSGSLIVLRQYRFDELESTFYPARLSWR